MKAITLIIISLIFFLKDEEHSADYDRTLFEQINNYRKSKKLPPFIWDEKVHDAAKHHTRYLSVIKDFVHEEYKKVDNIEQLSDPFNRLERYVTKDYNWVEENVAYDGAIDEIPEAFFKSWLHSPPHNSTMLAKGKKIYGAVCVIVGSNNEAWSTLLIYSK